MRPLVFGTMRMLDHPRSPDDWATAFLALEQEQLSWFHSSSEYESFGLFCDVLSKLRRQKPASRLRHVVKLGEPHFDAEHFSSTGLEAKVDEYLARLGTDTIDAVQWMWRSHLKDEPKRLAMFRESVPQIASAFGRLREAGKVQSFLCFPYSVDFARAALQSQLFDGLAVYRNEWEHEYDDVLNEAPRGSAFAIRPFAGGKGFKEGRSAESMVRYALAHPSVGKVVLTATDEHMVKLLRQLDQTSS